MHLHHCARWPPFRAQSAAPPTRDVESTLTDRCKTTVPDTVRRALRLSKRDKIHYSIRPSVEVVLTRAEASEGDGPVLGQFLGFLARDVASHPERLQAVGAGLVQRLQSLREDVEVDLDAALSAVGLGLGQRGQRQPCWSASGRPKVWP